jgi:hypothetical protein
MGEYRNSPSGALGPDAAGARHHVVRPPERTDGVGTALRNAFGRCARASQEEFADLLGRLDKLKGIDRS